LALAWLYIADTLVDELDEFDELDEPEELPPELLEPPPELAANPAPWGSATPTASANATVRSARLVACILFLLRKSRALEVWAVWLNEQAAGSEYSSRCITVTKLGTNGDADRMQASPPRLRLLCVPPSISL
jgi:hypothetical protein